MCSNNTFITLCKVKTYLFHIMEIFNHPRHCYVNVTFAICLHTYRYECCIYSSIYAMDAKLVYHLGDAVSWLKTSLYSTYDF